MTTRKYKYAPDKKPRNQYSQIMNDVFKGWQSSVEMKIDEKGRLASMMFISKDGYRWVGRYELEYLADKLGLVTVKSDSMG